MQNLYKPVRTVLKIDTLKLVKMLSINFLKNEKCSYFSNSKLHNPQIYQLYNKPKLT